MTYAEAPKAQYEHTLDRIQQALAILPREPAAALPGLLLKEACKRIEDMVYEHPSQNTVRSWAHTGDRRTK